MKRPTALGGFEWIALRLLSFVILTHIALSPLVPAHELDSATAAAHDAWIALGSEGLDPRARATLTLIAGPERQLLALRAYLRAGTSLAQRWSWSQEQLSLYPSTPEGKTAMADLDVVLSSFAAANPGYLLRVNRDPRSLEVQIRQWSENESVGEVAAALVAALDAQYRAGGVKPSSVALRRALEDWKPAVEATLAAPGLSAHGQGRAFDFQVEKDGQVIAGPEAASALTRWDMAGWTAKLKRVVNSAGTHFSGPLESPYEPWHYAYTPAATPESP